jgi:hypothetical protein
MKPVASLLLAFVPLAAAVSSVAHGQEPFATWSQVEAAKETREYKEKLRDGGCDAAAKTYLTEIALPQLAVESNRRTIDRVRRRMREVLLTEIGDDKAFQEVSRTVSEFMLGLARDEQADPAVRINAMLLVGDMKARDGKPWPPAVTPLAAAVRDAKLPAAVRVAAVAGLARHAEVLRTAAGEGAAAFAQEVGPAVLSIVTAAAQMPQQAGAPRAAETIWMTSRALAMLPVASPTVAKDVAGGLMTIMGDASWPIDVRVRAASALGATATPQSGLNPAQTIGIVRGIAIAALEADIAAANSSRSERAFRSQGSPGPANATIAADLPEQVARRDAWRLVTLADAVLTADEERGLAKLAGKDGEAAATLATALRENGVAIDAMPVEETLVAALDALRAPAEAATPKPAQPAAPPAVKPASPPEAAPASPFDASPFGK